MAINGINAPITRPQELARLAGALQREPVVAVDTESNSLFAYQERVCLIQFSTRQEDYLVDPLALTDLSVLAPLFANPQIEKVFHAAEYDLLCMKRDFGFDFANLFDTMLAARILKRKAVGLGSILEEEFGVSADKRQQRANWGERPLRPHLLDYARMDTHYLIPLRERMGAELEARGMGALAREDFRRLCQVDAHITENGREPAWRVSGVHTLSPAQTATLNELCNYREHVARAIDRPLFKVIGDKTLVAIAEAQPGSLDELEGLPGMTPRQIQRHGKHILQAVQRGKQAKPLHPPRPPRPDPRYLARLDALRLWRKEKGKKMGVESDIVLPRDVVFALAESGPKTPEALAEVLKDVPWRLENFGPEILEILKKR